MKRTVGDHKPPVAPKPKVLPKPVQTERPSASELCVYQHNPLAVKSKVKPEVAPKPCLFKPPSPFNSKHLTSKEVHQPILQEESDITKNVGVLNFRNGMHTGNNKPKWDYVIPICVCNDQNCADCSPKENNQNVNQHGNSLDPCKAGNTECPRESSSKSPLRTQEEEKNLVSPILSKCISRLHSFNNDNFHPSEKPQSVSAMQTTKKHQKNMISSINSSVDSGQTPEPLKCSVHCSQPPKSLKKAPPVALPRKNKMEQPKIIHQESAGLTKFTALPVDVNNPDPLWRESPNKVNINANINAVRHSREIKGPQAIRSFKCTPCNSQGTPAPVPRQKIPKLQQNKNQQFGVQGTENKEQNLFVSSEVSSNTHLKKSSQKPQPDRRRHDNIGSTEFSAERLPKKTPAFKGPLRNDGHINAINTERNPPLAFDRQIANQNQASDVPKKKTGFTLKPKSKSLSSADIHKPDGLNKTSFLRIMDIDCVKKVPKLSVKSGLVLDLTPVMNEDTEESHSEICSHTLVSLHSGHLDANIPQDEQSADEDLTKHLENSGESEHAYEDIPEYENLPPFSTTKAQDADIFQNQSTMYEDDGIYEIPDLFPEHYTDTKNQQFLKRNVLEEEQELEDMHSEEDECSSEEEDDTINREKQTEKKTTNKSKHIVNEILSSEKVFVQVLKLLHVDFREAVLKASCQAVKAVIDERVVNQILCSLPQLYELNCDLLKELEERVTHWNKHCRVADIFVKRGPYLKMYSNYICEFSKNVALLEEHCRKNPAFAKVVKEFESNPCCANLAVKHYMLKPIQRIPQYQLLLTDYLNNLDEESPDYRDAEAALVIVKEVANHANEFVRQEDNSQRLYEVQCRLIGNHVIVKPGRVLLKEGILMKLSRKVMQPRMFFLTNDCLLYTTQVASGNFKLNNVLPLASMKVSKPSQEGYQNELNIESVERSFILSARSKRFGVFTGLYYAMLESD
ncbi:FYVE, RhoGEF and PH domain-containing protein 6-like isoform X2 [Pimephales promelas]|uniref:FYVE, RhoGEF and PH domain-containing protein 6-like isoform X2 n=1 Tax=Pimephales promelas TaxID=90988 RepID=UPI001955F177|nr:FYVE, RhoGEF and PH domain-containing protein 6-like isoform X2 [Pimephales promelas]